MSPSAKTSSAHSAFRWLHTGEEGLAAMLEAIAGSAESVRLETYIFSPGPPAERFRAALVAARRRGVRVQVLVDALGSGDLPDDYFAPVVEAGGEFRRFNPLALNRLAYRDHRKMLVCDDRTAIIGGFNIAVEYDGDGVNQGWRDLGLHVAGPLAPELAESFDGMFEKADFTHRRLQRLLRTRDQVSSGQNWRLLLSGPGRRHGEIKRSLTRDLATARSVQIVTPYFLPTWRLRRALLRAARRGGRVQLLLAGKSDVRLSQLASRRLYRSFLRSGVEVFEYQPQVLHAKMALMDDTVYAGSSNLDTRSLQINYELMVRVTDPHLATEARALFDEIKQHSRRIETGEWHRSRTFWNKLMERWAYFVLARLDPLVARWQLKRLR